ncbi:MAG: DUF2080 family transposase-associated protein [Candidatus Nitrosopolaris sp.]
MKTKRDITKVQALASEFGSGAHIILPKSWKGKRVVCMLKVDYDNGIRKSNIRTEETKKKPVKIFQICQAKESKLDDETCSEAANQILIQRGLIDKHVGTDN